MLVTLLNVSIDVAFAVAVLQGRYWSYNYYLWVVCVDTSSARQQYPPRSKTENEQYKKENYKPEQQQAELLSPATIQGNQLLNTPSLGL